MIFVFKIENKLKYLYVIFIRLLYTYQNNNLHEFSQKIPK